MNATEIKAEIAATEARIAELRADMLAAGKDEHGCYIRPHNDESAKLQHRLNELRQELSRTDEAIRESIAAAQAKGKIGYAAVHPVSQSSIGLYEYSPASPSGRFQIGTLPNTARAWEILAELGIVGRISNAVLNPVHR